MAVGRFAPSPTGRLHIGNLRTALLAWLFARSTGSAFLLRFEDLDQALAREEHYQSQMQDLLDLGLDWDGQPIRQTDRLALYQDAIAQFRNLDRTYACYCTRKDIREATQAPNGPQTAGHYPGTCRSLTLRQIQEKERSGRPPAIRVRADDCELGFVDQVRGPYRSSVDDFVIQRNDGTPAYNLAVVVDDSDQEIAQVVRGDDLLSSTVRQLFVARSLDLAIPSYAHVPLVLAPNGKRLAKRDGAVTLADRLAIGESAEDVLMTMATSLGLTTDDETITLDELLSRFDPRKIPIEPFTLGSTYLQPDTSP